MNKTYLTRLTSTGSTLHSTEDDRGFLLKDTVALSPASDKALVSDGFKPGILAVEVTQLPPLPEGFELSDCYWHDADLICALFEGTTPPEWLTPTQLLGSTFKPLAWAKKLFNPEPGTLWRNAFTNSVYTLTRLAVQGSIQYCLVRFSPETQSRFSNFREPANTPARAFGGKEADFEQVLN